MWLPTRSPPWLPAAYWPPPSGDRPRRGWWADLAEPAGSETGFRRPVVVVQGNPFNASTLRTVVCVVLTSNLRWADAPGNVLLAARGAGLPKASVANVTQLVTLNREALTERAGRLSASSLELVIAGIETLLGRG